MRTIGSMALQPNQGLRAMDASFSDRILRKNSHFISSYLGHQSLIFKEEVESTAAVPTAPTVVQNHWLLQLHLHYSTVNSQWSPIARSTYFTIEQLVKLSQPITYGKQVRNMNMVVENNQHSLRQLNLTPIFASNLVKSLNIQQYLAETTRSIFQRSEVTNHRLSVKELFGQRLQSLLTFKEIRQMIVAPTTSMGNSTSLQLTNQQQHVHNQKNISHSHSAAVRFVFNNNEANEQSTSVQATNLLNLMQSITNAATSSVTNTVNNEIRHLTHSVRQNAIQNVTRTSELYLNPLLQVLERNVSVWNHSNQQRHVTNIFKSIAHRASVTHLTHQVSLHEAVKSYLQRFTNTDNYTSVMQPMVQTKVFNYQDVTNSEQYNFNSTMNSFLNRNNSTNVNFNSNANTSADLRNVFQLKANHFNRYPKFELVQPSFQQMQFTASPSPDTYISIQNHLKQTWSQDVIRESLRVVPIVASSLYRTWIQLKADTYNSYPRAEIIKQSIQQSLNTQFSTNMLSNLWNLLKINEQRNNNSNQISNFISNRNFNFNNSYPRTELVQHVSHTELAGSQYQSMWQNVVQNVSTNLNQMVLKQVSQHMSQHKNQYNTPNLQSTYNRQIVNNTFNYSNHSTFSSQLWMEHLQSIFQRSLSARTYNQSVQNVLHSPIHNQFREQNQINQTLMPSIQQTLNAWNQTVNQHKTQGQFNKSITILTKNNSNYSQFNTAVSTYLNSISSSNQQVKHTYEQNIQQLTHLNHQLNQLYAANSSTSSSIMNLNRLIQVKQHTVEEHYRSLQATIQSNAFKRNSYSFLHSKIVTNQPLAQTVSSSYFRNVVVTNLNKWNSVLNNTQNIHHLTNSSTRTNSQTNIQKVQSISHINSNIQNNSHTNNTNNRHTNTELRVTQQQPLTTQPEDVRIVPNANLPKLVLNKDINRRTADPPAPPSRSKPTATPAKLDYRIEKAKKPEPIMNDTTTQTLKVIRSEMDVTRNELHSQLKSISIDRIADKVIKEIERRAAFGQQRRGL